MGQYTNGLGSGGREGARGLAPSYLRAVPLLWVLHRMMAVPGSEDRARPATVIACYRTIFLNKPATGGTSLNWHQDRWIGWIVTR